MRIVNKKCWKLVALRPRVFNHYQRRNINFTLPETYTRMRRRSGRNTYTLAFRRNITASESVPPEYPRGGTNPLRQGNCVSSIMASLSSSRIALVTGANQGIGLEIVRQLSKKFDGSEWCFLLVSTRRTSVMMYVYGYKI